MTTVKICGIRKLADAQVAAQAGADFIGLNFVPGRRRRLEADAARDIVSGLKAVGGNTPQVVGLFADQPLDQVNRAIEDCELDLVQLCGQETPDYCRQMQGRVIKVVRVPVTASGDAAVKGLGEQVQVYRDAGHLVVLDSLVEGLQGGSGQSFDWNIAAGLARRGHSFLLAGGLSPDNIAQAVAMVQPWGVDVSSGVETDGVKDPEKIQAFIHNARQSPNPSQAQP